MQYMNLWTWIQQTTEDLFPEIREEHSEYFFNKPVNIWKKYSLSLQTSHVYLTNTTETIFMRNHFRHTVFCFILF